MEITLTVQLSGQDAAAIAKVKHAQPDDMAEIKDYLNAYLDGAVEAAHLQLEQDADTKKAPVSQNTRHAAEPVVIRDTASALT